MIALHGFMSNLLLDLHQKHDSSESSDETDATATTSLSVGDENSVGFVIVNDNPRSIPPSLAAGDSRRIEDIIKLIRTTSDRSSDRWRSNSTFSPQTSKARLDTRTFARRGRPTGTSSSSSSSSSSRRSPPPPLLRVGGKQQQRSKQERPDLLNHRAMSDSALVVPRRSKDPPEHYKDLLIERIKELPLQRPLLMDKSEPATTANTAQDDIIQRRAQKQHEQWGYYYYSTTSPTKDNDRYSMESPTMNNRRCFTSKNKMSNTMMDSPNKRGSPRCSGPQNREFIHTTLDLLLRSLDDNDIVEDDDDGDDAMMPGSSVDAPDAASATATATAAR